MKHLLNKNDCLNFIEEISLNLKKDSRYISELKELIKECKNIDEINAKLILSRGANFSGEAFLKMNLSEKIYSCLITPETYENRFNKEEGKNLIKLLPLCKKVLSLPCSKGLEIKTLNDIKEKLSLSLNLFGADIQPSLIEEAKEMMKDKAQFYLLDIFKDEIPENYDLIICRNFLGYFPEDKSLFILNKLYQAMPSGGYLMLDDYFLKEHYKVLRQINFIQIDKSNIFQKPWNKDYNAFI